MDLKIVPTLFPWLKQVFKFTTFLHLLHICYYSYLDFL